MSGDGKSPECGLEEHRYCAGPKVIRREGAPATEVPVMVLRCDCTCHRQDR